jgi:hypothetical protein
LAPSWLGVKNKESEAFLFPADSADIRRKEQKGKAFLIMAANLRLANLGGRNIFLPKD